jgi:hypothetical protein
VTRPQYAGDAEYLGVCEERGFSSSERKSPYRRKIGGPWRAKFCSELWWKGCPYNFVPLVSTDILCHPFNHIKSKYYAPYYSAIIHGHFLAFAEILVYR